MAHIPFDYCDECGRKFPYAALVGFLCEECRDPVNPSRVQPEPDERDAEDASRIEDAREGFES